MTFNIQIKVDTSDVPSKIKQVGDSLASLESKSLTTNKTLDASTLALKAEAAMFEKIRGPMREYESNMAAVQSLYQKNTISAKELTDQVTKLNAQFEKAPKHDSEKHDEGSGFGSAVSGRFGAAGEVGSGIGKGMIEAGAVVALASEMMKLGDEYTKLANEAVRFTDATHNTNDVLNEQYQISKDVHGSLEQTAQIYSAVREGTDELNMSHRDQIALTKSLAMEVELSGKSMDQAGGLMQRLSFAMESGILTSRDLRATFKEFPAIMRTLEGSTGRTSKELLAMAAAGALAPKAMMDALIAAEPTIAEKHAKMREGFDVTMQHIKDWSTLKLGGFIDVDDWTQKLRDMHDPTKQATVAIEKLTDDLRSMSGPFGEANRAAAKYSATLAETARIARLNTWGDSAGPWVQLNQLIEVGTKQWDNLAKKVHETRKEHHAFNEELARMIDLQLKQPKDKQLAAETKQRAYQAVQDDYWNKGDSLTALEKWKLEIAQLNDFYAQGGRTMEEYRKKKAEIDEEFSKNQYTKEDLADQKRKTETWKLETEAYKAHVADMRATLTPLEDALVNLAKTGKVAWGTMLDSFESMLIKKLADKAIGRLAEGLVSKLGGIVPEDGGGHATGGSYTAPPGGGTDSHRVTFRMSPNETAYFVPQGQQQAAPAPSSPAPNIKIVNQHDTRGELLDAIDGGAADTHIVNVMRRNAGAVRSALNVRKS